jgi:acetyltransferase-like isoleucine patch superfamily enzyme
MARIGKLWSIFHRAREHLLLAFYDEFTIADFFRKEQGVQIGRNCRIIGKRLHMFGGEPYLIEIGNNVTIAEDVKFITHDGGVGVLRVNHPGLNVFGRITVRDNCFIGANAVLLPNVIIGPNSVVGAGSVVSRDVPPDTVAAGVPARVIYSLSDYEQKAVAKGVHLRSASGPGKRAEVLAHLKAQG